MYSEVIEYINDKISYLEDERKRYDLWSFQYHNEGNLVNCNHFGTLGEKDRQFVLYLRNIKKMLQNEAYNADEYQHQAMRTCSIKDNNQDKLMHGVLGLTSEAGEVAGIFQKSYQGHEPDEEHLIKECGDVLWMVAEILDAIHIPMSRAMGMNIEKLKERYPDGFDPEKSLHRKEGDV